MVVDLFLVYQFLRRLATPFNEWDAYELGIIDERGNLLKKRRELRTVKEREAFGIFDLMITKIKRLIEKIPGGKSRIASYAAALYLIKEDWEHMTEEEMEASIEEYFNSLDESTDYKFELFAKMLEDAPANAMGGGNIAGGGYNGSGDVKVPPAAASRYKKRNKKGQQKFYTEDVTTTSGDTHTPHRTWTAPKPHEEHDEVHTQQQAPHGTYPDHVHKMLDHLADKDNYQSAMKKAKTVVVNKINARRMSNTDAYSSRPANLDKTKDTRVRKQFASGKPMQKPIILHDTHTGHMHLLAGNTRLTHNTHGDHPGAGRTPVHALQYDSSKPNLVHEDCWDGYRQSGMKKKGDRMVPNCVPETKQAPTIGGVRMKKLGSKPGSYKSLVSRHLGKSAAKNIDKSDGDRLVAKGKKTGDTSLVRKGNFIKNVIAK